MQPRLGQPETPCRLATVGAAAGLAAATLVVALLESGPLGIVDASPVYLVPVAIVATRYGSRAGIADVARLVADLRLPVHVAALQPLRRGSERAPRPAPVPVRGGRRRPPVGHRPRTGPPGRDPGPRIAGPVHGEPAPGHGGPRRGDPDESRPDRRGRGGCASAGSRSATGATSRPIADTEPDEPVPGSGIVDVLARTPGDGPARWVRAHAPSSGPRPPAGATRLRIRIEAEGETIGSLWAISPGGPPGHEPTRLLALLADQLGVALHRQQLREAAIDAEISRRSDALKSSLVTSVSHDIRTPLAGIRAAAGEPPRSSAPLDREVHDPGGDGDRRGGDAPRPDGSPPPGPGADRGGPAAARSRGVRPAVDRRQRGRAAASRARRSTGRGRRRRRPAAGSRRRPALRRDHRQPPRERGPARASLGTRAGFRCQASATGGSTSSWRTVGRASRTLGSTACSRPSPGRTRTARIGRWEPGIGLAVVRGFAEAMGVEVTASPSPLGGLAVTLRLPTVDLPPARGCRVKEAATAAGRGRRADATHGQPPTWGPCLRGGRGRRRGRRPSAPGTPSDPTWSSWTSASPTATGRSSSGRIRREASTPILILSARVDEAEKVAALEAGADDYVTKPFGLDELRARVRHSSAGQAGPRPIRQAGSGVGPVTSTSREGQSRFRAAPVELTPREYELLRRSCRCPVASSRRGGCSARSGAMRTRTRATTSTSTSAGLRRKLDGVDPDAGAGSLIAAEPGIGYRVRIAGRRPRALIDRFDASNTRH